MVDVSAKSIHLRIYLFYSLTLFFSPSLFLSSSLSLSIYIYIAKFDGDSNLVSRHYKFISAENITILSVSSDGYIYNVVSNIYKSREIWKKRNMKNGSLKDWLVGWFIFQHFNHFDLVSFGWFMAYQPL